VLNLQLDRGAKTAMTLALRSPEIIHDIVSVDNAPVDVALLSNFGKYVQGMKKIEGAGVTRQAEADKILQDFEDSLVIRQFLLGNLYRPPNEKTQKFKVPLRILGSALDNLGDFPYRDPEEVRFEKPALFVRGTQSKYVSDEALPVIGKFFPRFELADIDCGHWVISEKPEDFRRGKDSGTPNFLMNANFIALCSRYRLPQTQRIEMYILICCLRVSFPS
jgi:pimeloyl-ACP methyl ester carboxylesterase